MCGMQPPGCCSGKSALRTQPVQFGGSLKGCLPKHYFANAALYSFQILLSFMSVK